MPRFRKKTVVVEATQWFKPGDYPDVVHPVPAHVPIDFGRSRFEVSGGLRDRLAFGAIKTLEGWHVVSPGDWIITGVKGEKYPCKPDIFDATYEKVD